MNLQSLQPNNDTLLPVSLLKPPSKSASKEAAEAAEKAAATPAALALRSGADTVELSPEAAEALRATLDPTAEISSAAQPSRTDAQTPPITRNTDRAATQHVFTQADVDSILKLYGASEGQSGFDASFDFNGDGKIDFSDLNFVLSNVASAPPGITPPPGNKPQAGLTADDGTTHPVNHEPTANPATPTQQAPDGAQPRYTPNDLTGLINTFGKTASDQGFNPAFDLDGNGKVDFNDLNSLLSNLGQPVTGEAQQHLTSVLEAFGAQTGDPRYNPDLDHGNKGYIGFIDLNRALDSLFTNQA